MKQVSVVRLRSCLSGLLARLVLSVVLVCTGLTAARAQDAPAPPPFRSLFGSDGADPPRRQTARISGLFNVTQVRGTLAYERRTRRMSLGADTTSTVQYYRHVKDTIADNGAGVSWRTTLGRRTTLSAAQRFRFSESYQLSILPELPADSVGSLPVSSAGEPVSRLQAHGYTTNLGFARSVGRRSSIEASYDRRSVDFTSSETDLSAWDARGRFTSPVTRHAALQLGYGQRVGQYGAFSSRPAIRTHDLDLGMSYNATPSQSRSKETTLSVVPGFSIVDAGERLHVRMRGEAVLNQRFGRRWTGQVVYRRSLQFVEGFAEPFFGDSVTTGVAGYLGGRVELATAVGYSTGEIGLSRDGTYDSYSGWMRASVAMTRHWAVSVEYSHYDHRFGGDIALPGDYATTRDRRSLRVGAKWWKRLLQ